MPQVTIDLNSILTAIILVALPTSLLTIFLGRKIDKLYVSPSEIERRLVTEGLAAQLNRATTMHHIDEFMETLADNAEYLDEIQITSFISAALTKKMDIQSSQPYTEGDV